MMDRVARASRGDCFNLILIGSFAALAILMAAVGIYGAMSYAIERRTQEFGVRIALGAQRSGILALALGESARLAVIGTVLGVAASLTLARLIGSALYLVPAKHEGLLYGVSLTDPLTLTSASLAVIIIAALAGFVPARRATRIDSIIALRCE
jgi:ABC-type antimicrobial peptide transport system permease subunit